MSGETEGDVSGWTVDTLRYHLEQLATDLDRRHEQRFEAQEKAVEAALVAQEKLYDAAFAAQKEAISKSEASIDRRLENVNEFRAQLADQAARFLQRDEYRAAHVSLIEKVDAGYDRLAERIGSLENRINLMTGQGLGTQEARTSQRLDNGQLIAVVSTLLAAIAVAVTLILALNG